MDFLRPNCETKFTRMDAYCDLLDNALDTALNHSDTLEADGTRACDEPFVITVTGLAERWNWHRATVRNFLDTLVEMGRIVKQTESNSYLVTMRLKTYPRSNQKRPCALILDDAPDFATLFRSALIHATGDAPAQPQQDHYEESDRKAPAEDPASIGDLTQADFTFLHLLFTSLASSSDNYEFLFRQCPKGLLQAFREMFDPDPTKERSVLAHLMMSLQGSIPPSEIHYVRDLSDAERILLEQIYHYYACRRCTSQSTTR
jgi:hypothetical protein